MNSRNAFLFSFAIATAVLAAASYSLGQSRDSRLDARGQILARLDQIQQAAQSFSFVAENDDGAMISNGQLFLTRKDALDSTKAGFQGVQKISYKFDRQSVSMLSPTTALAVGEGSSTVTLDDGRVRTGHFAQTVVLVLTNGEWKVFHSHRSFPPAN
jgi:ketosteroid isomerase-like protein